MKKITKALFGLGALALVALTGCDNTTGHYAPTSTQFDVCTVQVRTGMAKDRQACYAAIGVKWVDEAR